MLHQVLKISNLILLNFLFHLKKPTLLQRKMIKLKKTIEILKGIIIHKKVRT